MFAPPKTRSSRTFRALARLVLGLSTVGAAAGCRSPETLPDSRKSLGVKVIKRGAAARPVNDATATRLRLKAAYRRAMELYGSGHFKEAMAMFRAISREAARAGVGFPTRMNENLARAAAGKPPIIAAVRPKRAAPSRTSPRKAPRIPKTPRKRRVEPRAPDSETSRPRAARRTIAGSPVRLPALEDPAVANKRVSVNFDQADIQVVLKMFSRLTGITFLPAANVRGKVTLISPTKIRLAEVYKLLESILEVNGLVAIPAGDIVKIVPRGEAAKRNLLTRVGSDPAAIPQHDTVVTQIMPLRYAQAQELSPLISPHIGANAQFTIHPHTNTIVITDTSTRIHRIACIIREFDVPGVKQEVTVIRLRYASAQVLADQITQLMKQARVTTTRAAPRRTGRRSKPVSRSAVPVSRDPAQPRILADTRINSLIVVASSKEIEIIRGLVAKLDVERPIEAENIHVVYLKNASAEEIVKPLSEAASKAQKMAGAESRAPVQITADKTTNALIITASAQDYKVMEGIIAKLDIVRDQVLVEMRIVEVTQEALDELGVDWASLDAAADKVRGFGYTNFGVRVESVGGTLEGLAVGAHKRVGNSVQIGSILKALEKKSAVNILSTPHILTSNNEEATIFVGENIPVVKDSRVTETDVETPTVIKTYEYKDVGIKLVIKPQINQGGLVRLHIKSEFSKVIEGAAGVAVDTPTTAIREAETDVVVVSGATVVIGGLIRDDTVTTQKRVPVLSYIPLLGRLFRWDRKIVQKTNLLFFITPYVLTQEEDLAARTNG